MYFKRLIRECLQAIWRFLTKKRFISDYKKKKAILIIVFVFIDCYVLNDLIDGLTQLDFNETITAEASVGDVVDMQIETATFDEPFSTEEHKDDSDNSVSLVPPATGSTGIFSAYSADVNQTDSDPLTMASGKKIYDGAIACPIKYEFGTKIIVEGKEYICEDRMNSRYRDKEYFDILMSSYDEAIQFGRKELEFYVVS